MSRLTLFPMLVVVPVWLNWYIPLSSVDDSTRVGTVKIVKNGKKTKNPTKNPGAILMGVRVPSAVRDFSLESASSADSYSVHTAPVCNRMYHVCAHKQFKQAPMVSAYGI